MAAKSKKIPERHKVRHKIAESCKSPATYTKRRICLLCDEKFTSKGGLRLCPKCQSQRESCSSFDVPHKFHGSPADRLDEE